MIEYNALSYGEWQHQLLLFDKDSVPVDVNYLTVKSLSLKTGDVSGVGTENSGIDNPKHFLEFQLHNHLNDKVSEYFENSPFNETNGIYDPMAGQFRFCSLRSRKINATEQKLYNVIGTGINTDTLPVEGLEINNAYASSAIDNDIYGTEAIDMHRPAISGTEIEKPVLVSYDHQTGDIVFNRNIEVGEVVTVSYTLYDPNLNQDWQTDFFGQIADIEFLKTGLKVKAQDLSLRLDKRISNDAYYGDNAGTKFAEDVIRDILDAEGYTDITLNVPVPTNFKVSKYYVENETIWKAIQDIATVSGMYLTYAYNETSNKPELYLYSIDRTEVADYIVRDKDIISLTCNKEVRDVRNKIEISYYDVDSNAKTVTALNQDSIDLYRDSYGFGDGVKILKWSADNTTNIKTEEQAQFIADNVLEDVKDPYLNISLTCKYSNQIKPASKINIVSKYYFNSIEQFMMVNSVKNTFDIGADGIKVRTNMFGTSKVKKRNNTNFKYDSITGANKPNKAVRTNTTSVPEAVNNLVVTGTVGGVNIKFDKLYLQGIDIRGYNIYARKGAEPTTDDDTYLADNTLSNNYDLLDLEIGAEYYIKVRALNTGNIKGDVAGDTTSKAIVLDVPIIQGNVYNVLGQAGAEDFITQLKTSERFIIDNGIDTIKFRSQDDEYDLTYTSLEVPQQIKNLRIEGTNVKIKHRDNIFHFKKPVEDVGIPTYDFFELEGIEYQADKISDNPSFPYREPPFYWFDQIEYKKVKRIDTKLIDLFYGLVANPAYFSFGIYSVLDYEVVNSETVGFIDTFKNITKFDNVINRGRTINLGSVKEGMKLTGIKLYNSNLSYRAKIDNRLDNITIDGCFQEIKDVDFVTYPGSFLECTSHTDLANANFTDNQAFTLINCTVRDTSTVTTDYDFLRGGNIVPFGDSLNINSCLIKKSATRTTRIYNPVNFTNVDTTASKII